MRIDVVTIFPGYLAPLDLSLIGRARARGLLDLHVHDLRDFTHDRHNTVDDTPAGGGAGMVMRAQPWAEALTHVGAQAGAAQAGEAPLLLVPAPSGRRFTQPLARELAAEAWLAFACGRYEGIDERVYAYAEVDLGWRVLPVSLGDYVLNGGEVAVLAIIEAVARLLPGVVGNEESLVEESHEGGLLEYPVYTKPAVWEPAPPARPGAARTVPDVLRSGDHAAIADWRHRQRLERTAARRPDLMAPSALAGGLGDLVVSLATPADAGELLTLTRACWIEEYDRYGLFGAGIQDVSQAAAELADWHTWLWRIPAGGPVGETPGAGAAGSSADGDAAAGDPDWRDFGTADSLVPGKPEAVAPDGREVGTAEIRGSGIADSLDRGGPEAGVGVWREFGAPGAAPSQSSGRLVASVRGRRDPNDPGTWQIGRVMVAPDLQGRGLGRALLAFAEARAPAEVTAYWLNTGARSERNLRIYRKAGYRIRPGEGAFPGTVDLTKRARRA